MRAACLSLSTFLIGVGALVTPRQSSRNDGIHLAVSPKCGPLSGPNYADFNAGINMADYNTIVSFGVSYFKLQKDVISDGFL